MTLVTFKPVYEATPGQELGTPLMVTGGAVDQGDLSLMDDFAEAAFLSFRSDTVVVSRARPGDVKKGKGPIRRRKD